MTQDHSQGKSNFAKAAVTNVQINKPGIARITIWLKILLNKWTSREYADSKIKIGKNKYKIKWGSIFATEFIIIDKLSAP